jgi:hypothetical protein
MRAVILILLAIAFAAWYGIQRGRVMRAREYSNAAAERWEQERGRSRSPTGVSASDLG